ncbi:response regulator [Derxia lacustris]|uniref:response regulator n=1 Tax=Derxia lacustris TaxID=764842 RepID=UPI001594E6ED|nr:response regulator [Derxia lacustris]
MTSTSSSLPALHQAAFARVLARNVGLPLLVSALTSAVFLGIVFYMLSMARWVEHADLTIARANAAQKLLIDAETGMRGYLLTGVGNFLEPYALSSAGFDGQLAALREFTVGDAEQAARIDRIADLHRRWVVYAEEVVAQRRDGATFDGIAEFVRSERGKTMMDAMRTEFAGLIGAEEAMREQRNAQASATITYAVAATLLIGLLSGVGLALNGRRQIRSLAELYGASLDAAARHARALERDAWMSGGETELAAAKAGERTAESVAAEVLTFFARRFGATLGAAYLSRDLVHFDRVAVHAFTPDAAHPARIVRNAGLIGQTAADGRPRALDALPDDYLRVTSALGGAAPRHLRLFAAHGDRGVNAVIELGFMQPPHEAFDEFVQTVEGRIGRAIDAAIYRERLHDVLTETQRLNEELQAQQEELKVANEELEEQSRVLRESQARMENQQAELEQNNEQLDQRNQLLDAQKRQLDERNAALREAQAQLLARAEELQRASRYKSEFLANMSHELRTPLNSTLILARLLADNPRGNLDEEQVRFAESIVTAGNDLLNLINDILDLSKVEAGKLDIRPERVALAGLLGELEQLFRPIADAKGLAFELELRAGLPESLVTDPLRLQQILKNLLANACKFTDAGSVRLVAAPAPDGRIALTVEDSGIGITPAQIDRLFDAFTQADGSTSRRFGGTGLGLSISRQLVQLMGGRIAAHSTPGVGSRFTFSARLDRAADDRRLDALGRAGLERARVLVVDDNAHARELVASALHDLGCRPDCAENGIRALALAHAADTAGDPYALVVSDWRMPGMSGVELAQALRLTSNPAQVPRVLLLTAHSLDELTADAQAADVAALLSKPLNPRLLQRVIADLALERLDDCAGTPDDAWSTRLAGSRVLLVEDNLLNRQIAVAMLESVGVTVGLAENGQEALDRLAEPGAAWDAVLMDVQMPGMDGLEATRAIRADRRHDTLPVIALTAHALPDEREKSLAAGMNAHLTKPIDARLLFRTLAACIEAARGPVDAAGSRSTDRN